MDLRSLLKRFAARTGVTAAILVVVCLLNTDDEMPIIYPAALAVAFLVFHTALDAWSIYYVRRNAERILASMPLSPDAGEDRK